MADLRHHQRTFNRLEMQPKPDDPLLTDVGFHSNNPNADELLRQLNQFMPLDRCHEDDGYAIVLVNVKVAAVTALWLGLKFVYCTKDR